MALTEVLGDEALRPFPLRMQGGEVSHEVGLFDAADGATHAQRFDDDHRQISVTGDPLTLPQLDLRGESDKR